MKRLLVIALVLLIISCRHLKKETQDIRWEQTIRNDINDDSPSCSHLMTIVWSKNEIARCWFDNTCGLTDSIVLLRQQEAEILVKALKQVKN